MATIKHIYTSPQADGTDTSLVRPTDWNSAHLFTLLEAASLSGNTAGVLALVSSGTFYLAGGNNITLSQNANSVTFSGGNTSQFLTTAMASNRGSDFVQATATIAGTNISGTIASDGISLSADAGGGATDLGTVDRAELDAQPWEYVFAGSNITITESPSGDAITIHGQTDALTTAMASDAGSRFVNTSAGLNLTSISATFNSNSISLSVGAYITTAMASNRGSDFVQATAAFAGTNASGTIASGGISVSVQAPSGATVNVSAGTTSGNLTQIVFSDLNNNSWGLNGSTITIVQPDTYDRAELDALPFEFIFAGNNITISDSPTADAISIFAPDTTQFLTTAMVSDAGSRFVNTSAGLNLTSISATFNSNSISLSVGAYITTAMASNRGSDFVQATAAFAGTGASGTIASAGISVNVADQTISLTDNFLDRMELDAQPWEYVYAGSNLFISESPTGDAITIDALDTWDRAELDALPFEYIFAGSNITISDSPTADAISIIGPDTTQFLTTARGSTDAIGLNTAGTNLTWTANSSGLSINAGGYAGTATAATNATFTLNTAGLSLSVAGAGAASLNISAGTTSNNATQFVFSDGGGVTWGLNSNTITASAGGGDNSLADWIEQDWMPADYIFGSNLTITEATNTDPSNYAITISAPATSSLVGSNGISISTAGSTITVMPIPLSLWGNIDAIQSMATGASAITQTSGSSMFIQPFILQRPISASYMRLFASFNDSAVGTAGTTSNAVTFSVERYTTIAMVIYSQGAGANSRSIQAYVSTSVGLTGYTRYSGGANGSQYTMSIGKTYPATGAANNNYGTSFAASSASIKISSQSNTLFTGPLYLDIPFASSLSPGNYWLGIGASTSSASNSSHISFAGTCAMPISLHAITQTAMSMGILGAVTSASDHQLFPGLGVWTTNASGISTGSIALSQVSQVANNPMLPFMFIRQA